MQKDPFMPRSDEGKSKWIDNFSTQLPFYAPRYNVTPEEVAQTQQDALVFASILSYRDQLDAYVSAMTGLKNVLRDGLKNGSIMEIPMPPTPMFPGALLPGIFARCSALGNRIKSHINYNVADGNALGLEGAISNIDLNELKPLITIRLVNGGHPEIVWKKKGMDGIEIHKEDANGNLQLLAYDSSPNFIDMSPLPPPGTSVVWRYRVIYLRKDQRVGQWSDMVSITVTG
jgi:hypothetical protein